MPVRKASKCLLMRGFSHVRIGKSMKRKDRGKAIDPSGDREIEQLRKVRLRKNRCPRFASALWTLTWD